MTTTTFIEFDGDSSNKDFAYTFPTYKLSEVKVSVSGVIVDNWTIPAGWAASGSNTIRFDNTTGTTNTTVCESSGAPKTGTDNVRIFRDTDIDTAKYTFNAGSSIKAAELNTNHEQLRRALQEEQYNTINTHDIKNGAVTSAKLDTNIDIAGTLDVTGATTLDSTLSVAGTTTAAAINASGAVGVDGNFDVNTNKFTVAASSGNTTVAGTLGVTGTTTAAAINASGAVGVDGNFDVNTNKFTVAAASGNTTIAGTLDVTGTTTYSGQHTTSAGTLANNVRIGLDAANEVSTSSGNLVLDSAGGTVQVTDTLDVVGNITVSGTVDGRDVAADGTKLDGAVLNSDLDGKGEILIGDGSGDPTALSVGTNNYVLTADSSTSTGVAWKESTATGEANQNAFSNVAVSGQTTVAADSATDTLTLAAGSNVTITTNDSTDTVTIAASGGGGAAITIQDEGSSLSTAAETINFVGAGVTASGTGTTKTITISGGGGTANATDFKFLELKTVDDVNTGPTFNGIVHDYELVTKGTTTAVTPSQAAALLISIGGVIQQPQPNQGDIGAAGNGSDGFAIDGSSIHFGAGPTAAPDFIIYLQGSGVATIGNNTVSGDKIALGSDASGDIMYYNGTDYVRLAKGSDGEVLKLASGVPSWGTDAGGTDTTYSISCVDGDNTDEEKIRLTAGGSGSGTDDIVLEAGTGLSIARSSDKITFTNTVTQLTTEQVEDIVGGMLDGTETGISVTYDDTDGNIDFVVGTLNQDTTGTADHVTITDNENTNENNLIPFVEDAQGAGSRGLESDGDFHYNPSSGTVTATAFAGSGAALTGIAAGATGGSTDQIFWENGQTITTSYTIGTTLGAACNALSAGPITIDNSVVVTIDSGDNWTIV